MFKEILIQLVLMTSYFFVEGQRPRKLSSAQRQRQSRCRDPVVRREIRQLSKRERSKFFQALRKLNIGPNPTPYDKFSDIHIDQQTNAHGTTLFLPWHRMFIREMEKQLQVIDSSIVLPYWDWSIDYANPATSELLTSDYFGGNGDPITNCVLDGPFANLNHTVPEPKCLQRQFNTTGPAPGPIDPFADPKVINFVLDKSNFTEFSDYLEVIHANVHAGIGGDKGDFSYMYSPNDPLFYVLHSFVDLLWTTWQYRHPNIDEFTDFTKITSDHVMLPYNVPVSSVVDNQAPGFCYMTPLFPKLSEFPKDSIQAQSETIDNSLRPLSNHFIHSNHMNLDKVRSIESILTKL